MVLPVSALVCLLGLLGALVLTAIGTAGAGAASAREPRVVPVRATTGPAASTATGRTLGVATAGAPSDLGEVDAMIAATGVTPDQVTFYTSWAGTPDFPAAGAARVASRGAVPEIVWEPWKPGAGVVQPAYSLARIAGGSFDAYVRRWARQVRAYGRPVVLRLAHEANGTWYPWAVGVNGNTAAQYIAAWKRVVGLFAAERVTNVTWSWTQNIPYPGATPLARIYPGDAVVGRVGLDGYNFGTTQSWSTWTSFADLFGPGVAELDRISSRPVHVDETGSTEWGGDKGAWISDAWAWLAAHREVRGVTWFSLDKETDWRVNSSDRAWRAFAAGVGSF
ncbi:glycoside hydrolase family 26 protein [Nocardioides sp.]|uniref:glycoside hydrolase family 26 protein n=1 Tax=Nocardioides sp. TaxID=35761 RepID=UPI0035113D2E